MTIQEGTRLSDILISYNLSLNELREVNPNFNPEIIVPGTELCIPPEPFIECPPGTTREYVIQVGDSLSSVAAANNMTPSRLLIANPHLRPANFLIAGTRVCIPAA